MSEHQFSEDEIRQYLLYRDYQIACEEDRAEESRINFYNGTIKLLWAAIPITLLAAFLIPGAGQVGLLVVPLMIAIFGCIFNRDVL